VAELAQTNVQLIRQLVERGWEDPDLQALRSAYELAIWLFSGQYRANGKTQIAHHVGVSSALAGSGAKADVVLAGLVHSAYFLGEFGEGRLAISDAKRARVTASVGPDVEALVHCYTELEWDAPAVRQLAATATDAPGATRDAVAMRLANEIDEYSDAVARFSGESPAPGLRGDAGLDLFVEVARGYGLVALGEHLHAAAAAGAEMSVPDVLVSPEDNTVFVPPASYRRRLHVALQDSRLGHEMAERVPGARELAKLVRRKIT
jgi:hypothetical protein